MNEKESHPINLNDDEIKKLWSQFEDVPMNPETECMDEPFMDFPAGTHREVIWHWFDEHYSCGVYSLLYPSNFNNDLTAEMYSSIHDAIISWTHKMECKNIPYRKICDILCQNMTQHQLETLNLSEYCQKYITDTIEDFCSKLPKIVEAYLDNKYHYCKQNDGSYKYELFADYRDEISDKSIYDACNADVPMLAFEEQLLSSYDYGIFETESEIISDITDTIDDAPSIMSLEDIQEYVKGTLDNSNFYIVPPYEHFLSQTVYVDIMMDTGDGNYDYCLNHMYPAYGTDEEEEINNKASIVWLINQQGYSKEQLYNMLHNDTNDTEAPEFLKSVKQEIVNVSSHMNTLTFLVKMTVKQVLALNEAIHKQDRNGYSYDSSQNPDCGTLTLDKSTMTGLFDPWNGGGSLLEIELEKPVVIPIAFIRSAFPDGFDNYGIGNVYGLCKSAWKETMLAFEPIKTE